MKEPTYDLESPIDDWNEFKAARLAELDHEKVKPAVAMLREKLVEALPELRDRITENPTEWIHGRKDAPCYCTKEEWEATAYEPIKPVGVAWNDCFICGGSGKGEGSLHHGWGTAIRNLLRTEGFGEEYFDVWNLDDYYTQLVELAVSEEFGLCLYSENPKSSNPSVMKSDDSLLTPELADSLHATPLCMEIITNATPVVNPPATSLKTRIGAVIVSIQKNIRTWLG